jgi:5-aminolevulinate synthase
MGPALSLRSGEIAAGYASVAGTSVASEAEVVKIHQQKGVALPPHGKGNPEMCPHASAARAAARRAEDLAAAKMMAEARKSADAQKKQAAAAGCPFHAAAESSGTSTTAKPKIGFDYEAFYANELDKKHKDNSYRYFNNINRLAEKFPVAHTGDLKDEVEVWCANDYLGMGNNPVVLETMQ